MVFRITPNFTLEEFLHSDKGIELGIVNRVSVQEFHRLRAMAMELENIRNLLGDKPIRITSGFRCPEINAAVGGVPNSDHALGYAVDFIHELPTKEVCRLIAASQFAYDQLINEFDRWTHISFNPRSRRQNLKAVKIRGRTEYKRGL